MLATVIAILNIIWSHNKQVKQKEVAWSKSSWFLSFFFFFLVPRKDRGLSELLTGRLGVHPKPIGLSKEKRANGREGRCVCSFAPL